MIFRKSRMKRIERSLEVLVGSIVERDLLRHALDAGEKLYSFSSAEAMANYLKKQYRLELIQQRKRKSSLGGKLHNRIGFYFTADRDKGYLLDILPKISDYLGCGFDEAHSTDFIILDPPMINSEGWNPKLYDKGIKEVKILVFCNKDDYEKYIDGYKRYLKGIYGDDYEKHFELDMGKLI